MCLLTYWLQQGLAILVTDATYTVSKWKYVALLLSYS